MPGLSRAFGLLRRFIGGSAPSADSICASVFSVCPRCGLCVDGNATYCPEDGAALPPPSHLPVILDERYRFERLLAQGGMGTIYRGSDLRLNRPVAIKVIRVPHDTAAERRLLREAATLSKLEHPSIVAVYDFGSLPDHSPYIVMEFVSGRDLRYELATEGRLEPRRACRILAAICAAMGAAHEQGILHCDLKPENVLLPDDGEEAKVLDFGVAQAIGPAGGQVVFTPSADGSSTAIGRVLVGTPAYMAPELLRGRPADERTDVFSIGVIAYETLVGDLPFGTGSAAEVLLAQGRGVPAAVATLPPALARAVGAGLELDADRRPPTPQALAYLIGAATGTL